ncbi:hypothetical protein [Sorangium sp. So ce693]|uniref:hypothetical protein n=1 Tax=Sorangium sp. So ce693 TaxID=3133318 RepID=UPI003F5DED4B
MSDREFVQLNRAEELVNLDLHALCGDPTPETGSPIDNYYVTTDALIRRTTDPVVAADSLLLRLLLLEVVAAAEMYFRNVLAALPAVCSSAQDLVTRSMMMLGAAGYYRESDRAFGVIEHASLSGKGEVTRYTRQLSGFDIAANSSTGVALAEFEQVCHLRHAIVHAQGRLWYRNACELGIESRGLRCVQLSALGLQSCVAKTHNAVRAYNRFISNRVLSSWISTRRLKGRWVDDRALLEGFHALFYSTRDSVGPADARSLHTELCRVLRLP